MVMRKGTSIAHLIDILKELKENGEDLSNYITKAKAKNKYDSIFKIQSTTTKLSRLREDVLKENIPIFMLDTDRDGNGIDFITAKLENDTILFQVVQQKGNSGSLNANATKSVLSHLRKFTRGKKIEEYFDKFPDNLNPNKTAYDYEIDVFLGYYLAKGIGKLKEFNVYGSDEYLKKVGIEKSIIDLEIEVNKRFSDEIYDAGATNFEEVYYELSKII